uniref:Uncharacterized protein n=1 Tax=Catharus ustulatus TaxID=91951 RepID=A0A8C3Y5X2_CATUS
QRWRLQTTQGLTAALSREKFLMSNLNHLPWHKLKLFPDSQVLTELSPFLGMAGFLGKRMSLEWYSLSLCTLACRDSVDLFRLRGSTEIPIVRANFLLISSRLKPLPARTFLWYLMVGHLTMGRMGPLRDSPAELAGGLVEPGGDSALPVLVEVGLQDHPIAAGRHGCGLRTRARLTRGPPKHPQARGQHPKCTKGLMSLNSRKIKP